jgi:hypothetical protein
MLKKKNYKEEDHFTQYYTFYIPTEAGKKIMVYYKRYRPKSTTSEKALEIYDIIHHQDSKQQNQNKESNSGYSVDRTL